jgi:hypothetical protein
MKDYQTLPLLSKNRIRLLLLVTCGLFAFIITVFYVGTKVSNLKVDWSFLLPLAALVSGSIPVGGVFSALLEKKFKEMANRWDLADSRLDLLEATTNSQAVNRVEIAGNLSDIHGRMIKLETRVDLYLHYSPLHREIQQIDDRVSRIEKAHQN